MTRFLVERLDDSPWYVEADIVSYGPEWIVFYTESKVETARLKNDSVTAIIPEDKS